MNISINYSENTYNYSKNTIDKKHYKIYVSNKFNYVNYDDFIKNSEINFLGDNIKVIPITDINSINEVTVYFALMILINGGIYNNKILLFWVVIWSLCQIRGNSNLVENISSFTKSSNDSMLKDVSDKLEDFRFSFIGDNDNKFYYIYMLFNDAGEVRVPYLIEITKSLREFMISKNNKIINKFKELVQTIRLNETQENEIKIELLSYFRGGLQGEIDGVLKEYEELVKNSSGKGIRNPSVSCFGNSVMQLLYHIPELVRLFENYKGNDKILNIIKNLFDSLRKNSIVDSCNEVSKIIISLYKPSINVNKLSSNNIKKELSSIGQQDVSEFFQLIQNYIIEGKFSSTNNNSKQKFINDFNNLFQFKDTNQDSTMFIVGLISKNKPKNLNIFLERSVSNVKKYLLININRVSLIKDKTMKQAVIREPLIFINTITINGQKLVLNGLICHIGGKSVKGILQTNKNIINFYNKEKYEFTDASSGHYLYYDCDSSGNIIKKYNDNRVSNFNKNELQDIYKNVILLCYKVA